MRRGNAKEERKSREVVFLAGPAYCPEEFEFMESISEALCDAGFQTFLAARDAWDLWHASEGFDPGKGTGEASGGGLVRLSLFVVEVFQLVSRCGCVVFNVNGRVPEEEGCFQSAFAFAVGRPVVLYKRDVRSAFHGKDNAMISGLSMGFSTAGSLGTIPAEVSRALEQGGGASRLSAPDSMPPYLEKVIDCGRSIWELIEYGEGSDSGSTARRASTLVAWLLDGDGEAGPRTMSPIKPPGFRGPV